MRILHVLAPAHFGGLEQVVRGLAVGHQRRGHDVRVALVVEPGGGGHPLAARLRDENVEAEVLELPPRAYRAEWLRLGALISEFRPDVVHTHGYRTDLVAGAAARRAGVFTVSTAHGFTGGSWKNRLYEWLQRRAWRRFGAVIAVSELLREQLVREGLDPARVRVIRNAWAESEAPSDREGAREHLGIDREVFRLAFVGRLSHEKGLDVAVRALAELTDTPAVLAVVGEGPERTLVEALAASLGCAGRIEWYGVVPDAGRWLRAFDALVLSSRTEGTPIVLFEAMAAGLPVVAASVGGVPHVVSASEALLVPPEDPAALAAAIRGLVADPHGARDRARAAAERLRLEFAVDPWLKAHEDLYASR